MPDADPEVPATPAERASPPLPSRPLACDAPFFVLMNAGSGHHDGEPVEQVIAEVLQGAGRSLDLRVVDDPARLAAVAAQAVAEARERGGVVVAAGGDGTINAVAQATLGTGCAFGVLPLGTFNYFSRTHGIPSDTRRAAELLLSARAYQVQVGQVNDRVFLVNASLGLYPQLLEDREQAKRQFGRSRLVALWSALKTLLREHRQLRLRIETDQGLRVLRTPTLFVGNNRLQLEQIGIAESGVIEQGQLAAVALRPVGTLSMLWLMLRGALGRLGDAERVLSFPFRTLGVKLFLPYGSRKVKVATDGEIVWMRTPLVFRVASQPLWLLRPEQVDGDPG